MNRFPDLLCMISTACVVPGSILALGQAQEVTSAPRRTVIQPPLVEKKQEAFSKAEVAKNQGKLEARPVPKAAVAAKAMRVPAVPTVAVLEARAARRVPGMWPMFRAEYYFIRNACDLNADQRKALARLGESAVKAAARQFAEAELRVRRTSDYPDPHKLIEDELARAMGPLLSPVQQARYKEEIEKRAASRKQFIIDNLVAKLDQDLVLSAEQRTRLVEALSTNWKDAWGQAFGMLIRNNNFFPDIPDHVIVPILTDHQREVWGEIPIRQNPSVVTSFARGIAGGDPLDDPELADAQKEAEAKNKK